jgi:hypothetical protein
MKYSHPPAMPAFKQDVDGRDKPGHDEMEAYVWIILSSLPDLIRQSSIFAK